MCVALPARIVSIRVENGLPIAMAEIGGVEREVNLALTPEAVVGDHVVVHSGIAVRMLAPDAADTTWSTVEDAFRPR